MRIASLRRNYHSRICKEIVRLRKDEDKEYPNFADKGNKASRAIAWKIVESFGCKHVRTKLSGQRAGTLFEIITRDFLEQAFSLLNHLRPGKWRYSTNLAISRFDQYEHLAQLEKVVEKMDMLASSLGTDYIIKPDIVIGREPVTDAEINRHYGLIDTPETLASLTPLRKSNIDHHILHASVSCKWTLRSDRGQNARAEALNLVRHRKGNLPHVVAVTAEPLPTRIASLALGTGDMDCVYHFALPELIKAIKIIDNEDQMDMLNTLVDGRRLRDISDLPFDLAI